MVESELSKTITRAVRVADRLVRHIKRDTKELVEALRELGKDVEGDGEKKEQ